MNGKSMVLSLQSKKKIKIRAVPKYLKLLQKQTKKSIHKKKQGKASSHSTNMVAEMRRKKCEHEL